MMQWSPDLYDLVTRPVKSYRNPFTAENVYAVCTLLYCLFYKCSVTAAGYCIEYMYVPLQAQQVWKTLFSC